MNYAGKIGTLSDSNEKNRTGTNMGFVIYNLEKNNTVGTCRFRSSNVKTTIIY